MFSLEKVHWFQRIPKYICMLYLLIVIGLGAVDLFSYYHIRKRNETLEKSISRIFNGTGSKDKTFNSLFQFKPVKPVLQGRSWQT